MINMTSHEHLLRDLLLSVQIQSQMDKNRPVFMNIKTKYHLSALLGMLEKSTLHEQIEIINRSLFHRNECNINFCETDIFSQREGTKIVVHRELLNLDPSLDIFVQCRGISSTHISQYHNTIGQNAGQGKVVLLDKIIKIESLTNSTFVDLETRMINRSEIFLDVFVIFKRNLQCLRPIKIKLNRVETSCQALQVLPLEDGFQLEANSKTLTDFHIQAKMNKRLDFAGDYKLANLPGSF